MYDIFGWLVVYYSEDEGEYAFDDGGVTVCVVVYSVVLRVGGKPYGGLTAADGVFGCLEGGIKWWECFPEGDEVVVGVKPVGMVGEFLYDVFLVLGDGFVHGFVYSSCTFCRPMINWSMSCLVL